MNSDPTTIRNLTQVAKLWCDIQAAHVEFILMGDYIQQRKINGLLDAMIPVLHNFSEIWPSGFPNEKFAEAVQSVARLRGFNYIEDVHKEAERIRKLGPENPDLGGDREPVGI